MQLSNLFGMRAVYLTKDFLNGAKALLLSVCRRDLKAKSAKEIFTEIYRRNEWGDSDSVSGTGSNLKETQKIRAELPKLFRELEIRSLLDIPCGDFFWMRTVDLGEIRYMGADIVSDLVVANQEKYGGPLRKFLHLDLLTEDLPQVDLVLCRECFVHFSFEDIFKALRNIRRSGSTYLLMTHYPTRRLNVDIPTGLWRTLNFEISPFHFPPPKRIINEGSSAGRGDKSLALWNISDLPIPEA